MGRPSIYNVGDVLADGKLTVLEVRSGGHNKHSSFVVRCSYCNMTKLMKSQVLKKAKSCGCMRHNSSCWRSIGAQHRTWQLPPGVAAFNSLYYSYALRADNRGFDFELDKDYFQYLCVQPCHYCGSRCQTRAKGQGKTSGDFMYTGVDRKDPTRGYTRANAVACCSICNWMKHTLQADEFIDHVKKITLHQMTQFPVIAEAAFCD